MATDITESDETPGRGLSVRHEEFALAVAAGNSFVASYAQAYGLDTTAPGIRVSACRLARHPKVQARVKELRTAAAERGVISVRERMQWLQSIVEADPISSVVACGCRYCWGEGHYQWRDPDELAAAVTKATKVNAPMPDITGGFGFRPDAPANPLCAHCAGQRTRIEVVPFADMTAAQRALYRGVECNPDGSIKRVLVHDQLAAADMLNKLQAAYTSVSVSASMSLPSSTAPASTSEILTRLRTLRAPNTVVNP